jgi:hypothetical protein
VTQGRRAGLARLVAVVVVLAVVISVLVSALSSGPPPLPLPGVGRPARPGDPLAYIPSRSGDFAGRATAGNAHVLFTKSPGGAFATAARVASLRPLIDAAAAGTPIDPATLEAIVFLESAGNPNAIAGSDPAAAAGLTQIVAETGQSLLGMNIDLARSRALTAQIDRASALGQSAAVARLQRRRARIDDRFDPRKALAATVRYLELARHDFGRLDLAVVSYHMGIGNLHNVLAAYDGGEPVPYVRLFFDTGPDHNAAAYRILSGFGDDSWTYYWRVRAAAQIMRRYRTDPYVLHPPSQGQAFAEPDVLDVAYARRLILPLPSNAASLGLAYDPGMGSLAHRLGVPVALYRGLRTPTLDVLIELAARVRTLSGGVSPLIVTSTVQDQRYQQQLGVNDPVAAEGWTFTIARHYRSEAQALAFQALLDRLQSLDLIAWQRYPSEIEVTVASDAAQALVSGP